MLVEKVSAERNSPGMEEAQCSYLHWMYEKIIQKRKLTQMMQGFKYSLGELMGQPMSCQRVN